jgi:ribosomal protein S14
MKYYRLREITNASRVKQSEKLRTIYKLTKTYLLSITNHNNKNISEPSSLNTKQQIKLIYLNAAVKKNSKTIVSRRCVFSNKNKICVKNYQVGRHKLLEMLKAGVVPGYKKAVW